MFVMPELPKVDRVRKSLPTIEEADEIRARVATHFGVLPDDLFRSGRSGHDISVARAITFAILWYNGWGITRIALYFHIAHSSVSRGVRRGRQLLGGVGGQTNGHHPRPMDAVETRAS